LNKIMFCIAFADEEGQKKIRRIRYYYYLYCIAELYRNG